MECKTNFSVQGPYFILFHAHLLETFLYGRTSKFEFHNVYIQQKSWRFSDAIKYLILFVKENFSFMTDSDDLFPNLKQEKPEDQ